MNIGGEIKDFNTPIIMGILNLTPDSFYDGGKNSTEIEILNKCGQLIEEGGEIIDMGAYSSRPGAEHITENEEAQRLLNAISSVRKEFPSIIISVDTFRSSIAKMAVSEGANMINDISGGTLDDKMFDVVAKLKVPYILMHIKGNPQNMQVNPSYENVVSDVFKYFSERLLKARKSGINDVILDPGFGFGKDLEDNYKLLRALAEFKSFDCPILAGLSRKSMINKVLHTSPAEALNGTSVLNTIALLNGASILRVHDVKEAKESAKLVSFYQNA